MSRPNDYPRTILAPTLAAESSTEFYPIVNNQIIGIQCTGLGVGETAIVEMLDNVNSTPPTKVWVPFKRNGVTLTLDDGNNAIEVQAPYTYRVTKSITAGLVGVGLTSFIMTI